MGFGFQQNINVSQVCLALGDYLNVQVRSEALEIGPVESDVISCPWRLHVLDFVWMTFPSRHQWPPGARVHWRKARLGRHPHLRSGCSDCVPRRWRCFKHLLDEIKPTTWTGFSGVSFCQILILRLFFHFFFQVPKWFRGLFRIARSGTPGRVFHMIQQRHFSTRHVRAPAWA